MTRLLFVCLGNICRSPTAEAVFAQRAWVAGLRVQVDSCGTSGWHQGEPPYPPAIAAAAKRGYDLSALRARQISPADFHDFSHILVMDRRNLADVQALCPTGGTAPQLFMDYAPAFGDEVPDPWYTGEFDTVLAMIEAASDGLIAALLSLRGRA